MKILAFDISSVSTGVCVIEDGYLDFNSIQAIQPNEKLSLGNRLYFFEKEVKKLVTKYKPDRCVIEDIFYGRNIIAFKNLAMHRGIVFKVVWEKLKQDPFSIMPTEARKLVGCGVSKEEAFEFITSKYKLRTFNFDLDNDRADAIVLGLAYHNILKLGTEKEYTKIRKKKRKKKK